ncbi:MAG: SAM-dependent methyltransferase [Dehalococcoidia bacterium]|nr:SAM-dependent methyltransferase [Dehalococcoidia bacterium]
MTGEFEAATENAALKQAIAGRIRREGAITFRDFMEMALYHPQLGYYCSPREQMGRHGDYLTSPEVSSIFGVMVGRQLREMWEALDRPERFDVVEAGAGSGALARDVLRWARDTAPALFQATHYAIVELAAAPAERQRAALTAEGLDGKVRWTEALPEGSEGSILSNELLDSMPVHRVELRRGRLREVFVGWDGERFLEELREPSSPEIGEYFRRLDLLPGEGCRAEVNLGALRWAGEAARTLARGFVLTFDYGHEAAELFAPWRTDGTLLCFYRHNPSADPYARIGRQDMTSHVDFTSVRRAGEEAGLRTLGMASQSEFLLGLGIGEALGSLTPNPRSAGPGQASPTGRERREGEGTASLEEYYARRRAVTELLDAGGLGRIRVLVQAKGVPAVALTGLRGLPAGKAGGAD